jgi:hypothetical protein
MDLIVNSLNNLKFSSYNDINDRINREISYDVLIKLSDKNLMTEYMNCISVNKNILTLTTILEKYIVNKDTNDKIVSEYLSELIPPGTKGVIRGNKFNSIIKDFIIDLNIDTNIFDICFEKMSEIIKTDEIPDWYIYNKNTSKILIGMNQLDLWTGGHQLNRGYKYLMNIKSNTNVKILCVVCNKIQFKNKRRKAFKLFETGFNNNTLTYINNLKNIIYEFFDIY